MSESLTLKDLCSYYLYYQENKHEHNKLKSCNLFAKLFPILFNLSLFITNVFSLIRMNLSQSLTLSTQYFHLHHIKNITTVTLSRNNTNAFGQLSVM